MKLTDDKSVLEAISKSEVVMTKSGKVSQTRIRNIYATYCLIREKVLNRLNKITGNHNFISWLVMSCVLVAFQNLHDEKSRNIIPFVKLVEIDFNQQLPDWYQEPLSQFNYKVA
ncbi:phage/plasmid replication protein, II/X family [Acinetobacter stercoris]|uniref:Phage X family protein n=1 Tax=Acinetobacter stercoris TaxID=2126983 RepID=A0A2U3N2Y8_9GAMM|nr:phage/plasmid replication protein, II/X family [Acinetobacter stercoris]SPL72041.1 Phage X family protein [Acinetobacter stercoris]